MAERRYNKYLVRRNNPDYTRYKDSIWINKLNKVVIYIDIKLTTLFRQDVSITQFRSLLVSQLNYVTGHVECPICKKDLNSGHPKLAIDHSHKTGKVRGVLHTKCNSSFGMFRENIDYIQSAINYLNKPFRDDIYSFNTISKMSKEQRGKIRDELLAKQSNLCAICGHNKAESTKWAIDHDHNNNKIRGVLCHFCNLGLGLFNDNKESMENAIIYLKHHQ
jgi:hypothetical protein